MDRDIPNFDTLIQIARRDPEQLENLRRKLATQAINAAPYNMRRRLRGLQFKIDSTRLLAKTPMSACIRITDMMYQSVEELRCALNDPHPWKKTETGRPKARVIPLHRNRSV